MDTSKSPFLGQGVPVMTLLMVGGAVAVALFPRWASWLIYDRSAILAGELWRMFTGHWVHFSTRHLAFDLIPLTGAVWIMEERRVPQLGWFCIAAPLSISAATLVFEPRMRFCGGLSALATAAMTLLALRGLSDCSRWRWVCVAALLYMTGKMVFEGATGQSVFGTFNKTPVVLAAGSHLAGAATALIWHGQSKLSEYNRAF
jgi:rhomboid family GlyGly-CTERM serine protease